MTLEVGMGREFTSLGDALCSLPDTLTVDTTVNVFTGFYDENVRIFNKRIKLLKIRAAEPHVYLRNIRCYDITGLLRLEGLRFPLSEEVEAQSSVLFSRCNYANVTGSEFLGDLRGSGTYAVQFDGSNGSVTNCMFQSQQTCIYAKNASQVRVDPNNTHTSIPSNYFLFAQSAIIHSLGGVVLPSGTRNKEFKAGRIFHSADDVVYSTPIV